MRTPTIVLGSLVFLLLWSGAAQACTTPNWITVEGARLSPGETITVRGGGYAAGPVELRWGGLGGELIAEPTAGADGRFEVAVVIPVHAEEGRESVTGVQATPEGARLWGFTEIVVLAAAAPGVPAEAIAGLALGALLLAFGALGVLRRRRRVEHQLDDDLLELLAGETTVDQPRREDVGV